MAKAKDPVDVVASIRRSIEVSPKGSRRVRCHSLRALFGFQAWTAQRKDLITSLLDNEGIRAQPSVSGAGLHDWHGDVIVVYNYQGGAVPGVKVLDFKRSDLRERFDDLYRVLNPRAAAEARQAKVDKLQGRPPA